MKNGEDLPDFSGSIWIPRILANPVTPAYFSEEDREVTGERKSPAQYLVEIAPCRGSLEISQEVMGQVLATGCRINDLRNGLLSCGFQTRQLG
jgi:hypothetical protein